MNRVPTFFLFEVFGDFWYWPSWKHIDDRIDYSEENIATGTKQLEVIPAFEWPDTGPDTVMGLHFYGAMLTDDMTALRGFMAFEEWGYGP